MDGIHILQVRRKKYVLCLAGYKRGVKLYDVISPKGETICQREMWDDAIGLAKSHYVDTTTFPKRRSKPEKARVHQLIEDFSELDEMWTPKTEVQNNEEIDPW